MHGELTVCSGIGPVFNDGKRTQLSSLFHGSVCICGLQNKKKVHGDKQGLSGEGLAAASGPISGTVAWQIM